MNYGFIKDNNGNKIYINDNSIYHEGKKLNDVINAKANSNDVYAKTDTSDLINLIYPVGSIYMSVNNTNPSTLFGGTWEQIKGRFLIGTGGVEANTTNFWGEIQENAVNCPPGERGGEPRHKLTIDEIPPHYHNCKTYSGNNVDGKQWSFKSINNSSEGGIGADNVGGGQPHNNMPPYLAVFMWKRIS